MSRKRHRRSLTWTKASTLYENHLRARRCSPLTVASYRREIAHLQRHLERHAPGRVPEPAQTTLEELRAYMNALLTGQGTKDGQPRCAKTVHRITTALAGFFRFLCAEGLLPADPSLRLERPKLPERVPGEVLSVEEVTRLLAAPACTSPTGLRERALLEILYATGLRRAEVLALDLLDVDHAAREVRVQHGKGERGRIVPLTRSAYQELLAYLERGRSALVSSHPDSARALFLSRLGRRLSAPQLAALLKELGQRVGLARPLSPHQVRRTFATHLLRAGTSIRHIQLLLGHKNLTTTAVYLALDTAELRRELLTHHPRERMDP